MDEDLHADAGWRTSGGRERRSAVPRIGPVLAAAAVVAAMVVGLHFLFV